MALAGNQLTIVVGIVGNILSVVGVVIMNKYITEVDGFDFMIFLSFLHFAFTYLGLRILLSFNVFSVATAPIWDVIPVAAGSLLSVAFMNLNLSHNSVGFYQVAIIFCSPSALFNTFLFSAAFKISLYPIHAASSISRI